MIEVDIYTLNPQDHFKLYLICLWFWIYIPDHIHGRPALDWTRRKRIALGTARGLVYLHEQCDPKIIHRDVKAANILLDEDFEAVVGDFGLAKLLDHRDSHVTTAVRGTVGHIAPEYLSTGQSSEKTDVFGFGILLLELITGHKALDFGRAANQKGVMLDWVSSPDFHFFQHVFSPLVSISSFLQVLAIFLFPKLTMNDLLALRTTFFLYAKLVFLEFYGKRVLE